MFRRTMRHSFNSPAPACERQVHAAVPRLNESSRQRRGLCVLLAALVCAPAIGLLAAPAGAADGALPRIEVYKTPGCQCCEKWIEHLRAAGFSVHAQDGKLNAVRRELGIPRKLIGCHTATVGDYVVEGHVPAEQIKRLLREKPDVAGISVPGMPVGSPGMEGPGGQAYEVLSWRKDGSTAVFSREQPIER